MSAWRRSARMSWICALIAGCAFSAPRLSPPDGSTPLAAAPITQGAPAPPVHQLFLPIGMRDNLTPTPFQPLEVTPTFLPTAIPTATQPPARFKARPPSEPAVTAIPPPMPQMSGEGTLNILLIGSDQRGSGAFRTDTLIIASIQPQHDTITLISIPRDLFVYIPGWTMQRVNTAYLHGKLSRYPGGGPGLLKDTLLYNLGIRIDHIAMVDFGGFRKIVNLLGGLDIPLACAFTDWHVINPNASLENPNNWKLYTVGPGLVHMDGDLALWYARSRLRSNDFDRGRRQQEVLRAMYARAMQLDMLPRLGELYAEVQTMLDTDVSLDTLLALTPLALSLNAPRIRSYYINNTMVKGWMTPQGAAVLLAKRDKIQALIQEAMAPPDRTEELRLSLVVEVLNGTRNPNWETLAAERLHYAGFETRLGVAERQDVSKSLLIDFTPGQKASDGTAILAMLSLPANRLVGQPTPGSPVAYRLILGEDYKPCFNPSKLIH